MDISEYLNQIYEWASGRSDVKTKHFALYGYLLSYMRKKGDQTFFIKTEPALLSSRILNKNSYFKTLNDLEQWGYIKRTKGVNQFSLTGITIINPNSSSPIGTETTRNSTIKASLKQKYDSLPLKKIVAPRFEFIEKIAIACNVRTITVYSWVSGRSKPSLKYRKIISEITKIPIEEI